jgi:hypothetical protein
MKCEYTWIEAPVFSCVCASGGPPDGSRLVHRRKDELFTQQYSFYDGETTPV